MIDLVLFLLLKKILGGLGLLIVKFLSLVVFNLFEEILNDLFVLVKVNFLIFLELLLGFLMLWNIKFFNDFIFGIWEKFKFVG